MKTVNNLPEIKAVAFDIDGTLYPNWRLYTRMVFYFLKNLTLIFIKIFDIIFM